LPFTWFVRGAALATSTWRELAAAIVLSPPFLCSADRPSASLGRRHERISRRRRLRWFVDAVQAGERRDLEAATAFLGAWELFEELFRFVNV
jgi:hypothetical protein